MAPSSAVPPPAFRGATVRRLLDFAGPPAPCSLPGERRMSRLECALAVLARERRWRIRYVEADGAGYVEIAPGITLEVDHRAAVGWTIGIEFGLRGAPQKVGDLRVCTR